MKVPLFSIYALASFDCDNADDNDSDSDYCMPSIRLRVYLFIVQQNALNQLIV